MVRHLDIEKLKSIKFKDNAITQEKFAKRIVFVINDNDLSRWFKDHNDKNSFLNAIDDLAKNRELSGVAKEALYNSLMNAKGEFLDEDFMKKMIEKSVLEIINNINPMEEIKEEIANVKEEKRIRPAKNISTEIKEKLLQLD